MRSGRENWLFKVKEIARDELCLFPERRGDAPPLRGQRNTLLDHWHINFMLPKGTDPDDAHRIAALLNEWVQEVAFVARESSPEGA